ncbi:flavodoxin family protein [Candidatus Deferrimicrobium sp.]|uniref:flavodoxin family protein n=1 Tax=Candidatus Deferrimicrobium sp. TaxID=3060586 RepID=UPI00271C2309|nr:flavodoxin family protein [Candidatus Deferrimicrobium sp.]MDO8739173.1 flavodoxin family protein [Candidatus Deferrimicrobium sp.]
MRVVAFNGSARKGGNTTLLLRHVFAELEKEGIEPELVELSGKRIHGCTACYKCFTNKDRRCAVKGDAGNDCIAKIDGADGILLGSPTYFTDVTAEMKALIDRAGMVGRANGNMYRRKVGAAVVAVRRAGAIHAFDTMNHFFLIGEMIVPGSSYWNIGVGREIGDVEKDEEGVATMRTLGQNMAWLLKRLDREG